MNRNAIVTILKCAIIVKTESHSGNSSLFYNTMSNVVGKERGGEGVGVEAMSTVIGKERGRVGVEAMSTVVGKGRREGRCGGHVYRDREGDRRQGRCGGYVYRGREGERG